MGQYADRFVRIELPGGYTRIVAEPTYRTLCARMNEMARCLENAEFLDEAPEPPLRLVGHLSWWKRLFLSTIPPHPRA